MSYFPDQQETPEYLADCARWAKTSDHTIMTQGRPCPKCGSTETESRKESDDERVPFENFKCECGLEILARWLD